MPRTSRILLDNGIYHIVQRGNNKRLLFKSASDYKTFLSLIKRYKQKYPFELFNFCLMPNHIHLLLRIKEKEHLQKIFQGIFQLFQLHHRKKYDYVGILYQNRFKSILINNDAQLAECTRYIERNPLTANLVSSLHDYKWSSYSHYTFKINSTLLTENPFFTSLGKTRKSRKRQFVEYINQERPYEQLLAKKQVQKPIWRA